MKSEIHELRPNKLFSVSKRVVTLIALFLGTSLAMNANTIPLKKTASKEVKASSILKHKKHRKAKKMSTTETAKPTAGVQK